MLINQNTSYFQ